MLAWYGGTFIGEAQADVSQWILWQSLLQREVQDSQSYVVRPCLGKNKSHKWQFLNLKPKYCIQASTYVMYGVENYRLVTMLMFSFLQGYRQNPGVTHTREALYHKILPSFPIITQSWCSWTVLNRQECLLSSSYPHENDCEAKT